MTFGLTEITAIAATLVCAWGILGLVPHVFRPERRAAFWLAASITAFLAQGAGRTAYWDVLQIIIGLETAREFRSNLGGGDANWFWNMVLMFGGFSLLKLLHLLIPEDDR